MTSTSIIPASITMHPRVLPTPLYHTTTNHSRRFVWRPKDTPSAVAVVSVDAAAYPKARVWNNQMEQHSRNSPWQLSTVAAWVSPWSATVRNLVSPLESSSAFYNAAEETTETPLWKRILQAEEAKKVDPVAEAYEPTCGWRKIRVLPNSAQQAILRKWFGTARWMYNRFVDYARHVDEQEPLTQACTLALSARAAELSFVHDTPALIRMGVCLDFLKDYETLGSQVEIRERDKLACESIAIPKEAWNPSLLSPFCEIFTPTLLPSDPPGQLPLALHADARLLHVRRGNKYYLCVPPLETASATGCVVNETKDVQLLTGSSGVIALQPSVTGVITGYDPAGLTVEWGIGHTSVLRRLLYWKSDLEKKLSANDLRHKRRYRIRRSLVLLNQRIRDTIEDCHRKCIDYVLAHFHVIVVPCDARSLSFNREMEQPGASTQWKEDDVDLWQTKDLWRRLFLRHTANNTMEASDSGSSGKDSNSDDAKKRIVIPAGKFALGTKKANSSFSYCGVCGTAAGSMRRNQYPDSFCIACRTSMREDVNRARNLYLEYMTMAKL